MFFIIECGAFQIHRVDCVKDLVGAINASERDQGSWRMQKEIVFDEMKANYFARKFGTELGKMPNWKNQRKKKSDFFFSFFFFLSKNCENNMTKLVIVCRNLNVGSAFRSFKYSNGVFECMCVVMYRRRPL